MSLRDSVLLLFATPDRAFLALLAGILLITREFLRPGSVLPAALGGAALLTGLYSLWNFSAGAAAVPALFASSAVALSIGYRSGAPLPLTAAAAGLVITAGRLAGVSWPAAFAALPVAAVVAWLLRTAVLARQAKRSVG